MTNQLHIIAIPIQVSTLSNDPSSTRVLCELLCKELLPSKTKSIKQLHNVENGGFTK
jgi:hypothetical protein